MAFIMWPGQAHMSAVSVLPRFTMTRTATSYLSRSLICVETHQPYPDRLQTKPLPMIPDARVEPHACRLDTRSAQLNKEAKDGRCRLVQTCGVASELNLWGTLGLPISATSCGAKKVVTPGYLFNDDPTCRELK